MGKENARPAPGKENGKQEGVLKDDDLKDVVGAGLDSYVEQQYREHVRRTGGG